MTRRERYGRVLGYFAANIPSPTTSLHYGDAFQLLVATVLSAQCTDVRINLTTPSLFRQYPTPAALAAATEEEVYALIRSVSYPHNKARHLVALAKKIITDYSGVVPMTRSALQQLPGVGRKTANVVLAEIDNKPYLAVDTHVFRVAHRLGLVGERATTPALVEQTLCRYIPPSLRRNAHHWLIAHGRTLCTARQPRCNSCPFSTFCPSVQQ